MADELTYEFRAPSDKLKGDLSQARALVRQFTADAERDTASFADTFNGLLSSSAAKLNTGLKVALGDFGLAVDKLINITEAGLKGIPVVGEGIAAAYREVSGTLLDATERGIAYNDSLKQQQIQLGLVAGSAADVKRELSEISDIAFRTNVGRGFLVNAVEDLQLFNVEGQRAVDLVRALATQATATGGGEGRVAAVTDLIERVLETGKVDARVVRQFVRNKIPIYDIIAEELQVSKKRAEQLITSGTLSGEDFITILTHSFTGPKWTQAADEMTQTVEGMTRRYDTAISKLLGVATQPVHATTIDFLRQAVDVVRGPGAAGVASNIQSAISPVTGLLEATGRALASGDFTGGALKLGADIKAGLAKGAAGAGLDLAKSYLGDFAKGIGAQSPATEFIPLGAYAAQGWKLGFTAEMQKAGGVMGLFQGGRGALGGGQWSQVQVEFAQKILEIAREVGATEKQIEAAFAAANVESRFNLNNEGDRNSRGVPRAFGPFQMWPSKGWGTREQTLDPDYAIRKFFEVAARQSQSGTPGQLAQRVEQSAYPLRYDQQFGSASRLLNAVRGGEAVPTRDDELAAAVRDLAASTNWRTRGDRSPDEGRGRFQDLSPADQLAVIRGLAGTPSRDYGGADLTTGLGRFAGSDWSGVDFSKLDDQLWQGQSPRVDPELAAGLQAMAESVGLFNGKLKDSGVYIEGVGDVAQKDVIPALQMMYALMLDDQRAVQDFGQRGGEELEKVRVRVSGLGQSFRELGFTSANMKGIFMSSLDDAFSHVREGWRATVKTIGEDWGLAVTQMVLKAEAAKLADKLFGGGSKGGGWLGSLLGGVGRLFGLGGSSAAASAGASAAAGGLFSGASASAPLIFSAAPGAGIASVFGGGTAAALFGGGGGAALGLGLGGGSTAAGSTAGAGAAGGGAFGSLGALLTNPWTAVVAGSVIGGLALWKHFSHKTEKELQKAIQQARGVDVKDMGTLQQIKAMGEQAYGRGQVRSHLAEVINLPPVQELIDQYAASTGQGTRPQLPHEFLYNVPGSAASPITVNGNTLLPSPSIGGRPLGQASGAGVTGSVLAAVLDRLDAMDRRDELRTTAVIDSHGRVVNALRPWEAASPESILQKGLNTTAGIRAAGNAVLEHSESSPGFRRALQSHLGMDRL
jgi:tape measure domain-containing protein